MRLAGTATLIVWAAACGRIGYESVLPPADLESDCALWLRMDEAAWTGAPGEVRDACGEPNDGTALGGAAVVIDATRGSVGSFPEATCVHIADAPELRATDAVTMSAWANVDTLVGVGALGIVSKRDGFMLNPEYTLFAGSEGTLVDIGDEGVRVPFASVLIPGAWVQLTAVFDGSRAETDLYVDGQLAGTLAEPDVAIGPTTPPPLHVGCLWNGGGPIVESFAGRLDDVAVWTRALRPHEVAEWYERTRR